MAPGSTREKKKKLREIRRLTLTIDILTEDLDEIKDVLVECEIDYSVVLSALLQYFKKKQIKKVDPQTNTKAKSEIEEDIDSIKSPPWAKKLFKKIAKETHPDKVDQLKIEDSAKEEKKKTYIDSLNAINEGDFGSLVETACRLGVDFEMNHGDMKMYLNQKIEKIKTQISEIQSKAAWVWFHSDDMTRISIIENTCKMYSITPLPGDIEKIMKSIKSRDLTVLFSRRSDRKVGQRPKRVGRKQ